MTSPETKSKKAGRPLPQGFVPGPNDVIVGRGRKIFHHPGNKKLRDFVAVELANYRDGGKTGKSFTILQVFQRFKRDGGIFAKQDPASKGQWIELSETLSRTTIAQAFRDALHSSYRSSKHSKQKRRMIQKDSGEATTANDIEPVSVGSCYGASNTAGHMTIMSAFQASHAASRNEATRASQMKISAFLPSLVQGLIQTQAPMQAAFTLPPIPRCITEESSLQALALGDEVLSNPRYDPFEPLPLPSSNHTNDLWGAFHEILGTSDIHDVSDVWVQSGGL